MNEHSKIALILVLSTFLGSTMVLAREGDQEGMKMDSMGMADQKIKDISGNVSDIWKEIKGHEERLGQVIETNQLDQVHEVAFMIRDLSKALYEKSKGVSPVKEDEVKASVDEISKIADRLDQYGDAGDKAKTEEEFTKLQEKLETIKNAFPRGTLTK